MGKISKETLDVATKEFLGGTHELNRDAGRALLEEFIAQEKEKAKLSYAHPPRIPAPRPPKTFVGGITDAAAGVVTPPYGRGPMFNERIAELEAKLIAALQELDEERAAKRAALDAVGVLSASMKDMAVDRDLVAGARGLVEVIQASALHLRDGNVDSAKTVLQRALQAPVVMRVVMEETSGTAKSGR